MLRNLENNRNFNETSVEPLLKQDIPQIHIVLDVDDTLANRFNETIEQLLKKSHFQRLLEDGLLVNAINPYLFHPGAIEFIQWLFKIPNIKVSIFSDADEGKNKEFVQELLTRALGNNVNQSQEPISIYSRQHLVSIKTTDRGAVNQSKFFKLCFGAKKKDLVKILENNNLDNVILVENDPYYITHKQERNVLITRGTDENEFRTFYDDSEAFPDDMEKELLSINHIFYLVGVLSKILRMQNACLADNLFNLQYKSIGSKKYERDSSIYKELSYYMEGLSELQKINPKLEFYGGDIANKYFRKSNHLVVKR